MDLNELINEADTAMIDDNIPTTIITTPTVSQLCMDNVVTGDKLRKVQLNTLMKLKSYIEKTYGPMGSYTTILSGNNKETIQADYSKDGLKVLKNITFDSPIELSIQSTMRDICGYVEHIVGDGTSSACVISALVYKSLLEIMDKYPTIPPRKIVNTFKEVVNQCKDIISSKKRDITLEDIYSICIISTNGNTEVSSNIKDIYKKFGFDVNIDVDISNDENSKLKEYDGLTIGEGYSDAAYINSPDGTASIHNANVYAFEDPIDTPEMTMYMEQIIMENIIIPCSENEGPTPTVIIAPMIGRDGSGILSNLITQLYEYNKNNAINEKPPIMIITNISGTDEEIANDIERLCNCKFIKKYINADLQKADQEKGEAPTKDTITQFCGKCELVVADNSRTKFINPDGILNHTGIYESLVEFLKAELKNAIDNNEDKLIISRLKKRVRSLEAKLVEYLVGGISVSDRDALRDLVEDATKNCASAAEIGVGRAANYEGLEAIISIIDQRSESTTDLEKDIQSCIFSAYYQSAKILYSTVVDSKTAKDVVLQSIHNGYPFNVMDLFESYNGNNLDIVRPGKDVLCSINTDIEILDAMSKVVTIMATSNQCLLQATNINTY